MFCYNKGVWVIPIKVPFIVLTKNCNKTERKGEAEGRGEADSVAKTTYI